MQELKIISFIQEKGGVGKTTLSVHLAAWFAIKGERVVLVDVDAQANATVSLGIDEAPGVYDLLIRNASFSSVLKRADPEAYARPNEKITGELLVVPSNWETRNIASSLTESGIVREKFSDLENWADTIIFDTPPTPSLFHAEIYAATDHVIYPCVCEALSLEGLEKSMARLKASTQYRNMNGLNAIIPLGIIPTMYRDTSLHSYNLMQLREAHGDLVKQEIPMRITWSEAAQMRQSVFAYAPKSTAASDAEHLAESVYEQVRQVR